MAKRPITFPKTSADTWTNSETGVTIAKNFERRGFYAVGIITLDETGYRIVDNFRTLAEARTEAKRYALLARAQIRRAREQALIERPTWEHARQERLDALHTEALAEDAVHDYWTARYVAIDVDVILTNPVRYAGLAEYNCLPYAEATAWLRAATRMVIDKAHAEALAEDAGRAAAKRQHCTSMDFTVGHRFEYDETMANGPDWPEGYEICGEPAGHPIHVGDQWTRPTWLEDDAPIPGSWAGAAIDALQLNG